MRSSCFNDRDPAGVFVHIYALREVGTLILTYTGSVTAWLRVLEYFLCYGDGTFVLLKDFCGSSKSGIIENIFILLHPADGQHQ